MPASKPHRAAIAAASDGSVLINLVESLPAALQRRLAEHLGADVFVGIPLGERDARQLVGRIDDAAAEACAQLLGSRKRGKKARKTGPSSSRARR